STSLSPPFLTMSVQVGVWQRAITHRLLWQSEATTQLNPSAQRGHAFVPPQSTSVSPSFWMPSAQLTQTPPEQIPLWQSDPPEHCRPLAQRGQALVPPQPTPVPPSSRTAAVQ